MKNIEKPVRTEGGTIPGQTYTETHPSYALIGAARVSSTPGHTLFGSDFRHQNFILISVKKAVLNRGLASDYHFGREEYIEVALSEAQWATFVSTLNVGEGVPCTLERLAGQRIPAIEPIDDRRTQFNEEIAQDLNESIALMEEALAQAKTKAQREPIERAISRLRSGLPFVAGQFDEHAEKTLEKVKIEAEAYLTRAIMRAGLDALGAPPMLELAESTEASGEDR